MANLDAPFGLWPAKGTGGSTSPRITKYYAASDAAAIGLGSPVQLDAGVVLEAENGDTNILGVSASFVTSTKPTTDDHPLRLKAVYVFDDPNQIFEIQADAGGGALTDERSFVGNYFTMLNANAHNTTTLQSKAEADASSGSVNDAARPLLCVGISDKINRSDATDTNVVLQVKFAPALHVHAKHGGLT